MDALGRYWVARVQLPPLVFEPTGRFLRPAGRAGGGPGEFEWVSHILPIPGDSVLIIDQSGQRGTILGPQLGLARTVRIGYDLGGVLVLEWPSRVIVSGSVPTADRLGFPLHTLVFGQREITVQGSFGTDHQPEHRRAGNAGLMHRLAQSTSGFWSAERSRYRLHLWSDRVSLLRSLERRPSWFAVGSGPIGTPTTPPSSSITGIQEDSRGLLWVFLQVPAPTWRQAWPSVQPGVEFAGRLLARERLFRTMIEVIDARSATVVVARLLDGWVVETLPDLKAVLYNVDQEGRPHIAIVQLGISMPRN
jgi:hypothetical protein